jgi:hypothetical protein
MTTPGNAFAEIYFIADGKARQKLTIKAGGTGKDRPPSS